MNTKKNNNHLNSLVNFIRKTMKDSLLSNSIYLIASTALMSVIGFFSWIVIARLYTPHQIGLATTLISVTSLIANLSLMGLNVGIIRYLPVSKNKNEQISTSILIIICMSIIAAIIYLLGLNIFSPKLAFVKSSPLLSILFILFIIIFSLDLMAESIFIAFRKASYVLMKNGFISILKLLLPILFVTLAFYGIFLAIAIGTTAALIFSTYVLIKKLNYIFIPKINGELVKKMAKFSFGNYIAASLTQLPNLILPVIITNKLNPEIAAFYYIAMMFANFLYVIPSATAESLFAEGSHDTKSLKNQSFRSIKIILAIAIPAMIAVIVLGKFVLNFFGHEYAEQGYPFLVILTLSTLFLAATRIFATILKVQHKIRELIISYIVSTFIIFFLSYLFINLGFGLTGIGYAWLIGKFALAVGLFMAVISDKPREYIKELWMFTQMKIRLNTLKSE
jgi:O-antigen/teichoic acid export membrane protein